MLKPIKLQGWAEKEYVVIVLASRETVRTIRVDRVVYFVQKGLKWCTVIQKSSNNARITPVKRPEEFNVLW